MDSRNTAHWLSHLPQTLKGLRAVDDRWKQYRMGNLTVPQIVTTQTSQLATIDWDAVVCGGTLGIMIGATLAQRGWRVVVLERGVLRGRDQEWNISRHELNELVKLGLLTEAELKTAIATEYNPARIQFGDSDPVWVRNVLNIGVDPVYLLETLKQTFLAAGGTLAEQTAFKGATVHTDGVEVQTDQETFRTRLLIDAMGHFSPLVQQARQGSTPDGVCLVVGTCAEGYTANDTGDLILSFTPVQRQCQYFWEAFPARDGRTTYLFTYLDIHPDRIGLEDLFDDYWTLLPDYQQVDLDHLDIKRALFGFFPCYRESPLQYPWGRVLPVGDSSGSQSPLSFGGFGAMIRHLARLTQGIDEALRQDCLNARDLSLLQPYQPNLSVTWLFQESMRVGMDQTLAPDQINRILGTIFGDMASLGEATLKPFLQDVVQFPALTKTLLSTSVNHPALVAQIVPQVGVGAIARWLPHYSALAAYSALYPLAQSLRPLAKQLPEKQQYRYYRWLDALQYGTGSDYEGAS
ncbi:NAD(P)/FAD-dependent oxidoreductase [Oscillatoria sp. CS-180]|uniref:NAD(P)/FAD-dependent oxidoreductase n=1 Tax=Oscillatoria sp. CS-180 TaxID=3021720 RepID=UPI00232D1722|nr:FAD-binding oxidoreductase [Oscillatoria sp. CS-180]